MRIKSEYLVDFRSIDQSDFKLVGERGLLLGSIAHGNFPQPPGFVIPVTVYFKLLDTNKLKHRINTLLNHIDYTQPDSVIAASVSIKKLFVHAELPDRFINDVFRVYQQMGGLLKLPTVSLFASFNHNFQTLKYKQDDSLTVHGEANLILKIREIWARPFQSEILYYNHDKKLNPFSFGPAVVVQKNIISGINGFLYTRDPQTNNPKKMVIVQILDEIKSNEYTIPKGNYFELTKQDLLITQRPSVIKTRIKNMLTDKKMIELAKLGKAIEHNFYFPKIIKWNITNNEIKILDIKDIIIHPYPNLKSANHTPEKNANKNKLNPKSATKIYEYLDNPKKYNKNADLYSDGIGFISGNSFIESMGIHPEAILQSNYKNDFQKFVSSELEGILVHLKDKPLIYCISDITSDKYRNLKNGKLYDVAEINPYIGFHGLIRHLRKKEFVEMEIQIIKNLRDKKGHKNLWLMLPFVRTPDEIIEFKQMLSSYGLHRSASFKIWLQIATISSIVSIDKFIECGVDGVSIDSDSLTMLTLAIDRDNIELANNYNDLNDAVMVNIESAIINAKKHNIQSTIYGRLINLHPQLIEKFISQGLNSLTIPAEYFDVARKYISKSELNIIQKRRYV